MIPKIIHYCWFGRGPLPELAQKCIESWKIHCPDYQIIEWNEDNFDVTSIPYAKEAYEVGKYAFVADVARLEALYNYGGIYMDTDMELLKPIDELLLHEAFTGFENSKLVAMGIFGAKKRSPFIAEFLAQYRTRHYRLENGTLDMTTNVSVVTSMLENRGLVKNGSFQQIRDIAIYPADYFYPKSFTTGKLKLTNNSFAIHHYDASWVPEESRIWAAKHRKLSRFLGPRIAEYILVLQKLYREKGFKGIFKKLLRL